eukprot:353843-Chlamydomonas_euryale.AAC.2
MQGAHVGQAESGVGKLEGVFSSHHSRARRARNVGHAWQHGVRRFEGRRCCAIRVPRHGRVHDALCVLDVLGRALSKRLEHVDVLVDERDQDGRQRRALQVQQALSKRCCRDLQMKRASAHVCTTQCDRAGRRQIPGQNAGTPCDQRPVDMEVGSPGVDTRSSDERCTNLRIKTGKCCLRIKSRSTYMVLLAILQGCGGREKGTAHA